MKELEDNTMPKIVLEHVTKRYDRFYAVDDLNLVIASVGNRSNQLHITYRDLKEQVNACTTVEEVEAITWPED